jgi:hypothetical protein
MKFMSNLCTTRWSWLHWNKHRHMNHSPVHTSVTTQTGHSWGEHTGFSYGMCATRESGRGRGQSERGIKNQIRVLTVKSSIEKDNKR